jgi:hypothetical protein
LHLQDTVDFINGYENVTSPCYANVTKQEGASDIVFVETDGINARKNSIVFSANDNQMTPLAVSEKQQWYHISQGVNLLHPL